MNIIKNKKGFTLIELLAVIVILAILILIAASNIGAVTTRAKKNVLAIEGNTMIDGAKNAYQLGIMDQLVNTTGNVCFSVDYLKDNGYYSKGASETYSGSVLVKYSENGIYDYEFWIGNGSYSLYGATTGTKGSDASSYDGPVSNNCNGQGALYCSASEKSGTPAECQKTGKGTKQS